MYNYQCFQRDKKLQNECKHVYEQFLSNIQVRKENKKTLYNDHKKRIDAFILSALEAPIQINEHISQKYQPRTFLSANKTVTPFRMNSHTSSERLEQIAERNSFLDGVPFKNASAHKFRETCSNLSFKPFKYTSSSGTMRIMDHLLNSRMNQVQSFDRNKLRNVIKLRKSHMINEKNKKQVQQLFMPELRRKAYFNSMKSLLVQNPHIYSRQYQENQRQLNQNKNVRCSNIQQQQMDRDLKKMNKGKQNLNEHMNRKENAINALIKCKLMKAKCQLSVKKQNLRG